MIGRLAGLEGIDMIAKVLEGFQQEALKVTKCLQDDSQETHIGLRALNNLYKKGG